MNSYIEIKMKLQHKQEVENNNQNIVEDKWQKKDEQKSSDKEPNDVEVELEISTDEKIESV